MRLRIAAALGLAAGLIAASGFAAEPTAPAGGGPAPAPAAGTAPPAPEAATGPAPTHAAPRHASRHAAPMHAHRMPMRRGTTHAMARPDSEHTTIEQLNAMSLQAAKRGQNFSPPTGQR